MIEDSEENLSEFGYAPGWYTGTCVTCSDAYIGSKYTYNCKKCALDKRIKTDRMYKWSCYETYCYN